MSPIPENVVDKRLYGRIKASIHNELDRRGIRWGVYASGRLVREYKAAGGAFTDTKSDKKKEGISRWFMQRWINVCESDPPHKMVECGRNDASRGRYPVCRPYIRISPETPTTYDEVPKEQIAKACRRKHHHPSDILPRFKKK